MDEIDAEAIRILQRIRRDLRLAAAQEVHVSAASETPTDPQTPEATFEAWLRQRASLLSMDGD
jgi:hypothetical protein